MPVLLITIGTLHSDRGDALERYAAGVIPLIEAAGGTVLTRGVPFRTLVGGADALPDLVAVMRFPSAEIARGLLDSPEYQAQVPHRERAFRTIATYLAHDLMG